MTRGSPDLPIPILLETNLGSLTSSSSAQTRERHLRRGTPSGHDWTPTLMFDGANVCVFKCYAKIFKSFFPLHLLSGERTFCRLQTTATVSSRHRSRARSLIRAHSALEHFIPAANSWTGCSCKTRCCLVATFDSCFKESGQRASRRSGRKPRPGMIATFPLCPASPSSLWQHEGTLSFRS